MARLVGWLGAFAVTGGPLLIGMMGCSSQPCHHLRRPELAQTSSGATTPSATTGAAVAARPAGPSASPTSSSSPSATSTPTPSAPNGRVQVSKPDGSLQCAMAPGLSPAAMEKQLGAIKVYASDKRADGLMHIQVCGSPTGMVNVYEIPASSLKEAEKRGFKRFEAQP